MKYYLAIDIGASSGRHIIGYKNTNNEIETIEVYRFKNEPKYINDHLIWDIDYLFNEIKKGIKESLKKYPNIESLSIDTWGVDYVLLNNDKEIYPCYAYRDNRTNKFIEEVHSKISFEKLYSITGTQFQPFNTIYQLYTDLKDNRLTAATSYLMMPEYFIYKLTGIKLHEYTNSGTTGLIDLKTNKFSKEIIRSLNLKEDLFIDTYKPSTIVGDLKQEIINEVGSNIKVVLCPTHDTASAVYGIPMKINAPYISSGTWSLLGIKSLTPINNNTALESNFSNELGPTYYRVQKNIMGLWIIQCLSKKLSIDFISLMNLAKESNYNKIFDVNDKRYLAPKNMFNEIKNDLEFKYKDFNLNIKDIINSAYHSLAYSYKLAIDELENITSTKYNDLYIVGGGAKNTYLNELCKIYTNKNIIALPIEATSIGNLLSQMEENNG